MDSSEIQKGGPRKGRLVPSNGSLNEAEASTSTNQNTENKRKTESWQDQSKYHKFPKKSKTESRNSSSGPLYERFPDSIVLYEAEPEEKYNAETNKNGFVDVIVSPEIHKGKDLKTPLTVEQQDGLQFLWKSFSEGQGAILAHEMGLGKTRTIIAFIYTLLEQSNRSKSKSKASVERAIILGPKHAIMNTWPTELSKWLPNKTFNKCAFVYPWTKPAKAHTTIAEFEKKFDTQILLLSYDTYKKYSSLFEKYKKPINLLICDEAHFLKNDLTDRSKVLQRLKASVKIGVTGTPFQNTLEEFCNLVAYFRPETLSNDYKQVYCRPIQNFLRKKGELDDHHTGLFKDLKDKITKVVQFKNNSIDIDKHEMIVCIDLKGKTENKLGQMQHSLYSSLVKSFKCSTNLIGYQKIDLLKKLCIHPENAYLSLINHVSLYEAEKIYQDARKEMEENSDDSYEGEDKKENDEALYSLLYSAKLDTLFRMMGNIKEKQPNEKVIAVSNSKELLNHIERICKHAEYKFARYDGDSDENERKSALKMFNTDEDCFILLLSCKAGGTALNLTRANHMFLLDPDWNPSNDKQALGRIYRLGQTRTVYTYRFLCTGTIEEQIFLLQLSKEEIEKYLKDPNQDPKLKLPFKESDLLVYNSETQSHIRDKLSDLSAMESRNKIKSAANKKLAKFDNNYELQFFAQDLSRAEKYEDKDLVPDDFIALKNSWESGISFVFHKKKLSKLSLDAEIMGMVRLDPLIVKLPILKPLHFAKRDKNCYQMRRNGLHRGAVLIINNKNYLFCSNGDVVNDPKESDNYRYGSEKDISNVRSLFKQMDYRVLVKEDLTKEKLEDYLQDVKSELASMKPDAFLVFLMGHGKKDTLIMVDGSKVDVWTDVVNKFSNESFPEMRGKPKGFFFNFCQTLEPNHDEQETVDPPADVIVSKTASPGTKTYRFHNDGSIYIHMLVKVLMTQSCEMDVSKMLEELTKEMAELVSHVQVPVFRSSLKKKFYLQ